MNNKDYYEAKADVIQTQQAIRRRYLNVALVLLALAGLALILIK